LDDALGVLPVLPSNNTPPEAARKKAAAAACRKHSGNCR